MLRVIKDYLYSFIGFILAIATLLGFFDRFYPNLSNDAGFAVIFICILFTWVAFDSLIIKIKWGRDRKYGETLCNVTNGFSEIHKLVRERKYDIPSIVRACELLCTELATAFTVITGTKCNVAIKVLEEDKDENGVQKLKAITFSRSHDTSRNPKVNEIKHWVDRNTDFYTILEKIDQPKGCYFFANSLSLRVGYLNTSFPVYGHADPEENIFLRYWRWPLPYKSTIVVPICPCDEPSKKMLLGFLCVDSVNAGSFKKHYDVTLLNGVADGIYNLIKELSKPEDSSD